MRFGRAVIATAVIFLTGIATVFSSQAQQNLPVPQGGDPAMACGQRPDGRSYWTEYAFCNVPVHGPGKAKGLILWSHGVDGTNEQYGSPPPYYIRRLVMAGWDVIKINRNNLYEHGWTSSGTKHVDDLIARTQGARAEGYVRVIAAGQSYGGVISLEAGAKAPQLFYAIVANSPGHGSDAPTGKSGSSGGNYYNLDRYLLEALAGQRGARVVLSLPFGDSYHPNRDGSPIDSKVRATLTADSVPFVYFDQTMPISGHGAAYTNQFDVWYGPCIQDFLDTARSPAAGEVDCPSPTPPAKYLLPADLKIEAPGAGGSRWLGAWEGRFEDDRNFAVVVEKIDQRTATLVYVVGAGPKREFSMGWARYNNAIVEGDTIKVKRDSERTLVLSLSADGQRVEAFHYFRDNKLSGVLTRPVGGKL